METNADTIMLVEDETNDVALIKRAFRKIKLGCSLQVVNDGQEALDYLEGVSLNDCVRLATQTAERLVNENAASRKIAPAGADVILTNASPD